MKRPGIITALLCVLLSASCSSLEVLDHSFSISAGTRHDEGKNRHELVLSLDKGNLQEDYRIRWTLDGKAQNCLERNGSPVRQDEEFQFDEERKAVFIISGLDKGEHSISIEVANSYYKQTCDVAFILAPAPFKVETKILTENILESVLDIRFTEQDKRETYRATVVVDDKTVVKDTTLSLPHSSIGLGAIFPGEKTLHLSISDSYSTWTEDIPFTEPGRERFMDLTLDCDRDKYQEKLDYHLTAHENALPYKVKFEIDFLIKASAYVGVQDREGDKPYNKSVYKDFKEVYKGEMTFDGSRETLIDLVPVANEIAGYTEPSIVSWYWIQESDWYAPKEIVDVPYRIAEIIPDIELKHDMVPGVRIRIKNNTGEIRINGMTYKDKEIII